MPVTTCPPDAASTSRTTSGAGRSFPAASASISNTPDSVPPEPLGAADPLGELETPGAELDTATPVVAATPRVDAFAAVVVCGAGAGLGPAVGVRLAVRLHGTR